MTSFRTLFRTRALRGRLAVLATAVLLLAAPLAVAGCDSFIETEPLGELTTESFFETPEQAVQATNASYQMLRQWTVHVFAWLGMTDIASDDAAKGSTPTDAAFLLELDNLNWSSSNSAFNGTWSGYYQGIYRTNAAIEGIAAMDNIDPMLRNRLLGENRFLRAYYYFYLVRAFGGVPLVTEPLAPSEYEQERAPAEEVYAQIEEDLQFAVDNLMEQSQYDASDLGRATRGAARAMLAEVHLFQDEFQQACAVGQEVIDSGEYSLYPDYSTLFTPAGENSSESVFEVQAVALEEGGAGSQYSQVQGVRGFPNLGWGFNQPTESLEEAFEPGDPRQQATILFPWEILPYGNPEGFVVYINAQTPEDRYNQKSYTPPDTPGGSGNSGTNIRRIRYAYVLLNTAEACHRAGNEGLARDLVNQVRDRAREREVTLGFTAEALADGIATDVLGLGAGTSRVFVRDVDPDSWAADDVRTFESARFDYDGDLVPICVEQMDLVQAVAGTAVTSIEDYYAALEALGPGQGVSVELLRVTQPTCGTPGAATTESVTVDLEARQLLPPITAGGQALLEAIWHERRVEMAMEQHRWFDIIRQGRAEEVMAAVGKDFVPGKHENYPIPQSEVEIAGLQQNPGY